MELTDQEKYWRARGFDEGQGHAAKKMRSWFYGLTVVLGYLAFHAGYLICDSVHEKEMAPFYYGLFALAAYLAVAFIARLGLLIMVEKA
ncbi:MAG: hypothetical protein J0I52_12925 [Bordetella sp.]|nr:hypothetical protein [Bordetella sp.]